jgi:hypothetical protein
MKKIYFVLLAGFLFSCNAEQQPAALPEGAIPVTFDGHWSFPMMLHDSIPGNFEFDTGCYGLLLDSLYVAHLPIDTVGKTGPHTLYGAGEGKQITRYIMGPFSYRLDTLSYTFPYTIIVQLKPLAGKSSDGIIGWDYLKNHTVEFNADAQYIRVIAADSLPNLQGYEPISLSHDGNSWYITASVTTVEGQQITGDFLFDVGSGSDIWFTTAVAKQNNFSEILTDTISSVGYSGFGGKSESVSFRAKSVTIGSFEIKEPILSYSKDTAGILSSGDYKGFSKDHKGLLGAALLARFNMVIDFPHKQIHLKPANGFDKKDKFSRRGFRYVDRTDIFDGFIVTGINRNQNAETAGIQLGDTITHINRKPVKNMSKDELTKIWEHAKRATLTIRRANDTLQIKIPLTDKNL